MTSLTPTFDWQDSSTLFTSYLYSSHLDKSYRKHLQQLLDSIHHLKVEFYFLLKYLSEIFLKLASTGKKWHWHLASSWAHCLCQQSAASWRKERTLRPTPCRCEGSWGVSAPCLPCHSTGCLGERKSRGVAAAHPAPCGCTIGPLSDKTRACGSGQHISGLRLPLFTLHVKTSSRTRANEKWNKTMIYIIPICTWGEGDNWTWPGSLTC